MQVINGDAQEIRQYLNDIEECEQDIVRDPDNKSYNVNVSDNLLICCDNELNSYQVINVAFSLMAKIKNQDQANNIYLLDPNEHFLDLVGEELMRDNGVIVSNMFSIKQDTYVDGDYSSNHNYVFVYDICNLMSINFDYYYDLLMNYHYSNNTYIFIEPFIDRLPLVLMSNVIKEVIVFPLKSQQMLRYLLKTDIPTEFLPVCDQYIFEDIDGIISKHDISDEQFVEFLV